MVLEISHWEVFKNMWHAPLFWWLENFNCHSKNCDGWMI
jgi:hypothetical protein